MLYILLTGHQPFRRGSGSLSDLRRTVVTAGCYEPMVGRAWAGVSGEAWDLVARLLRVYSGGGPPPRLSWSTVEHSGAEVVPR